jgi:hypothetical protein
MYTTVLSRERWREERESNKTTRNLVFPPEATNSYEMT